MKRCLALASWLLVIPFISGAEARGEEKLLLAVASNFSGPMEKLINRFEQETAMEVEAVYSSTGKLFAQIRHGAPYDIFFAADGERPEILAGEGLCRRPFIYAEGELVLWSKTASPAGGGWGEMVIAGGGKKIAIANPETAPYGKAALQALEKKGLLPLVRDRLVYAQNVGQAFQYGSQGAAGCSFIALSHALSPEGKRGRYWAVPEAPRVEQQACILTGTALPEAAGRFLEFFRSEQARKIMQSYGYR